jgi:hypothetical protein
VSRVRRVQELRRSNAATPIPSGKRYRRPSKHEPWAELAEETPPFEAWLAGAEIPEED